MPFDGIVTSAVTTELQAKLVGGRINKIYQPTNTEIIITVRNNRQNHTLLLSIHPAYARFHLTEDTYQNPSEPPMFCMVLRKYLAGAIIESITQHGLERVVTIETKGFNEIGDLVSNYVSIEIMGRHSNILLLDDQKEKIISCLKPVPAYQNSYRTILPGANYELPPSQNKLDLRQIDPKEFVQRIDFNSGKIDRQIVHILTGVSPIIGAELVHQVQLGDVAAYETVFSKLQETVNQSRFTPAIYEGKREDFHVIPLTHCKQKASFISANELIDHFYSNKAERDRVKQQAKDLARVIKNEWTKNERKLRIHEKTLLEAENADHYQKLGELLTAHMHLIEKGAKNISVVDYYDPEQTTITIPLKTDKTPSENAQLYFKKYRKLGTAKTNAQIELKKTKEEIAYLEQIIQQIESARDTDIEDIREELRELGYIKKQKHKKKKRSKPMPEEFRATDGTTIYVGRNNKQNEYVTHKLAHREDIWLHTLDIPGSHVVIRDHDPSEQTLLEAAMLAAYFSKASQSSSVPVDYTKVRYVKKPAGAKPGFVIYTDQKSLTVTPDQQLVDKLKVK